MKTNLRLPYLDGLVLADPQYMDKVHIDVLLGAAVHSRIVEDTVIKGNYNELVHQVLAQSHTHTYVWTVMPFHTPTIHISYTANGFQLQSPLFKTIKEKLNIYSEQFHTVFN